MTQALTARETAMERTRRIAAATAAGGLPIGAGYRSGVNYGPTLDTSVWEGRATVEAPTGASTEAPTEGTGYASRLVRNIFSGLTPEATTEATTGAEPLPDLGGVIPNAVDVGQDARQVYLDQMTDAWRLQQESINAQYSDTLSRQQDALSRQQMGLGNAMDAYGGFEQGMAGLDTEIPYGAIAELDTSRVTRQFDEAEGRLGAALNLLPDQLSNQMVNEVRYFEDVTETMLANDIENTEQLHELGAVYAQAIADEAYSSATLEGQRAKIELKAQFDRAIYDAQREMKRTKAAQADAIKRASDQFQMNYPEFEMNREAITEATFFDMMEQNGMSREDAGQSWEMYQNVYGAHAEQIGTQADFDRFMRQELNGENMTLLDAEMFSDYNSILGWDEAQLRQNLLIDDLEEREKAAADLNRYYGAKELETWLSRNDIATLFATDLPEDQVALEVGTFVKYLRGAGFETGQVNALVERAIDLNMADTMVSYASPEAKAARQGYRITNQVDDDWESIHFGSMTIPVDSQYIHVDPTSGAVFPVAGPGVAFNNIGVAASQQGTPVVAAIPGTVTESDYDHELGYYVVVESTDGRKAMYSHLETDSIFKEGAIVQAGTSIGRIGNTGSQSTEDYGLHFTYWEQGRVKDPRSLFGSYGGGT